MGIPRSRTRTELLLAGISALRHGLCWFFSWFFCYLHLLDNWMTTRGGCRHTSTLPDGPIHALFFPPSRCSWQAVPATGMPSSVYYELANWDGSQSASPERPFP